MPKSPTARATPGQLCKQKCSKNKAQTGCKDNGDTRRQVASQEKETKNPIWERICVSVCNPSKCIPFYGAADWSGSRWWCGHNHMRKCPDFLSKLASRQHSKASSEQPRFVPILNSQTKNLALDLCSEQVTSHLANSLSLVTKQHGPLCTHVRSSCRATNWVVTLRH